eukprot:m.74372 g.74372  ORF g.74372 m.74372 type:complete len:265 (-) comp13939_c0_seq1:358-1152(-)
MSTYRVLLRGIGRLSQTERRDLEKTNAKIAEVLSKGESTHVQVHLFSHGVKCTYAEDEHADADAESIASRDSKESRDGKGRRKSKEKRGSKSSLQPTEAKVVADVNIFNILLAGANGRCFVFLARESQAGEREVGDHDIYVFQTTDPLVAAEMADKLNKESQTFMQQLRAVRSEEAAKKLHTQSAEAYKTEKLAFEQEASYLTKALDSLAPDEYEQMSFTGFVEEQLPATPMSSSGRPSIMFNGAIHEVKRASRRMSEEYRPIA